MGVRNKILLVDDDRLVHTILGEFLRSEGFEVSSALGWREVVAQIAHAQPDLIILDIMMPEISGYTIAETLKKEMGYEVPIMIYSSLKAPAAVMKGFATGSNAFLTKPSSLADILATVQHLLTERGSATPGA